MLKRVWNWMTGREPLVVVNTVAAAVYAFVQEAQGDLTGRDAWIAVGWALIVAGTRHFVSPAKATGVVRPTVDMKIEIDHAAFQDALARAITVSGGNPRST